MAQPAPIPGTTVFDGAQAMKGYALNKMGFSFNRKENREAFLADEEGCMARYGPGEAQKQAVRARNGLAMSAAGGDISYPAKQEDQ